MDSDTVVCIELVKRNEHVELLEYPHHGRGSFERLKTTIFAYSDRTGEHGAFESLADLLEAMNALVDRAEQLVLRAERLPRRKGRR